MKPLPAPYVPGTTDAERFDNAIRKMFVVSQIVSWLIACSCQSLQAAQNPPDYALYASFFRAVALLPEYPSPVFLNGQETSLTTPSLQTALDLTDKEAHALRTLARDCEAKLGPMNDVVRSLTLEARLAGIDDSRKAPTRVTERLKDIENRREKTVADHVRRLASAFGEARFQALDAIVRSKPKHEWFAPTSR